MNPTVGLVATVVPDPFGVLFPGRSFPLYASSFRQDSSVSWVLDMFPYLGAGYEDVKEVCIFLTGQNAALPPDKALAVYVQSPGSQFEYRGAITTARPSDVVPLRWPSPVADPPIMPSGNSLALTIPGVSSGAQIGVSVVDLATLPALNEGVQMRIVDMALRVGQNLFNFMQSFSTAKDNFIHVPLNILDLWLNKLKEKARLDPDFLSRLVL